MTWSADDLKRMEERGRRFRQDHSGDDRDEFKDNDQINTIPDGWGAEHTEYDIESDGDDWGDIEEEERYDIEEEISNSTANTPSDSSFHSLSETQLRELVKEVLREMRTPTPGQQAKAFLEDKGISCLHYIAPLGTSILIAKDGVVSYNRRKQLESSGTLDQRWLHSLGVDSLADPNVQSRRHNKVFSDGRSIHDFVPLYFATHTPMQYVKTKEAPEEQSRRIVYIELDVQKIFDLDDVLTTDGNAASGQTHFYHGTTGLQEIDWPIIHEKRCWSWEYKWKKAAEVLVPEQVPRDCISHFVTFSESVAKLVAEALEILAQYDQSCPKYEVLCDPSYFYNIIGGKLYPA